MLTAHLSAYSNEQVIRGRKLYDLRIQSGFISSWEHIVKKTEWNMFSVLTVKSPDACCVLKQSNVKGIFKQMLIILSVKMAGMPEDTVRFAWGMLSAVSISSGPELNN